MTKATVGIISLHVLVNTDNIIDTITELQEMVSTHPTTVDALGQWQPLTNTTADSVLDGSYKSGDMDKEYQFTTVGPNGDEVYHTLVTCAF